VDSRRARPGRRRPLVAPGSGHRRTSRPAPPSRSRPTASGKSPAARCRPSSRRRRNGARHCAADLGPARFSPRPATHLPRVAGPRPRGCDVRRRHPVRASRTWRPQPRQRAGPHQPRDATTWGSCRRTRWATFLLRLRSRRRRAGRAPCGGVRQPRGARCGGSDVCASATVLSPPSASRVPRSAIRPRPGCDRAGSRSWAAIVGAAHRRRIAASRWQRPLIDAHGTRAGPNLHPATSCCGFRRRRALDARSSPAAARAC
jgi:hypothetical protein